MQLAGKVGVIVRDQSGNLVCGLELRKGGGARERFGAWLDLLK